MILVTIINGEDLTLSNSRLFKDSDKAKEYFIQTIKDEFSAESYDMSDDAMEEAFDDGFWCDLTHFSVYVQDIPCDCCHI